MGSDTSQPHSNWIAEPWQAHRSRALSPGLAVLHTPVGDFSCKQIQSELCTYSSPPQASLHAAPLHLLSAWQSIFRAQLFSDYRSQWMFLWLYPPSQEMFYFLPLFHYDSLTILSLQDSFFFSFFYFSLQGFLIRLYSISFLEYFFSLARQQTMSRSFFIFPRGSQNVGHIKHAQ